MITEGSLEVKLPTLLYCACHAKMHLCRSSSHDVLYILTSKRASRRNGVHFFNSSTSKNAPNPSVLNTFDLLRATTGCTFLTSQLPKVLRPWCVLCILTWKRASRHNGAHFFDISTSKSGPSMVCFVDMFIIWEHPVFRFARMILRDSCSTSFNLALSFRGKRGTLDRWSGKIAKRIGMRPSALHSTFNFWRKSPRVASFLMLSTSKIEEVSQNCFDFGVDKFENWRSRAELLRFWCCQVQKLRKSRRIVLFSNL